MYVCCISGGGGGGGGVAPYVIPCCISLIYFVGQQFSSHFPYPCRTLPLSSFYRVTFLGLQSLLCCSLLYSAFFPHPSHSTLYTPCCTYHTNLLIPLFPSSSSSLNAKTPFPCLQIILFPSFHPCYSRCSIPSTGSLSFRSSRRFHDRLLSH